MARISVEDPNGTRATLRQILRLAAQSLGCAHVGVWRLESAPNRLVSELVYHVAEDATTGGEVLDMSDYPAYWQALCARRAIVAHDAFNDPQTNELTEIYLRPLGVTSLLDAPLFERGAMRGVVCHEHIGPPRTWTEADVALACTTSDIIATVLAQQKCLELEFELQDRVANFASQERLELLSSLTRSVSHDFGNTLMGIEVLLKNLAQSEACRETELVALLRQSVALSSDLVRQLSFFGRRNPDGHADLPDVVRAIAPILQLLVRDQAKLTVVAPPLACRIPASRVDLEQLLLNLVLNARDACMGVDAPAIEVTAEILAEHVRLRVRDNGSGIDPSYQASIFDAGFTTKANGSGVGLATVKRIASASGGTLTFTTQPGATEFVLSWPRANDAA